MVSWNKVRTGHCFADGLYWCLVRMHHRLAIWGVPVFLGKSCYFLLSYSVWHCTWTTSAIGAAPTIIWSSPECNRIVWKMLFVTEEWKMYSTADQINHRLTQHFLSDFESLNSWGVASVSKFSRGRLKPGFLPAGNLTSQPLAVSCLHAGPTELCGLFFSDYAGILAPGKTAQGFICSLESWLQYAYLNLLNCLLFILQTLYRHSGEMYVIFAALQWFLARLGGTYQNPTNENRLNPLQNLHNEISCCPATAVHPELHVDGWNWYECLKKYQKVISRSLIARILSNCMGLCRIFRIMWDCAEKMKLCDSASTHNSVGPVDGNTELTVPPKGKFPSSSAYWACDCRGSSEEQALFSQHNLKQKINLLFRMCRKLSWIRKSNRLCLSSRDATW